MSHQGGENRPGTSHYGHDQFSNGNSTYNGSSHHQGESERGNSSNNGNAMNMKGVGTSAEIRERIEYLKGILRCLITR